MISNVPDKLCKRNENFVNWIRSFSFCEISDTDYFIELKLPLIIESNEEV